MSEQIKDAASHWAESAQKTQVPSRSRLRGIHHFAVMEPGSRRPVKKIPKKLASRIYEQHVLTTAGLDEGLAHTDEIIEGWKKSL
jgi:hypothetical protein